MADDPTRFEEMVYWGFSDREAYLKVGSLSQTELRRYERLELVCYLGNVSVANSKRINIAISEFNRLPFAERTRVQLKEIVESAAGV